MVASSKVERSQGRVGRPLLGMPSFLSTTQEIATSFESFAVDFALPGSKHR